MPENWKTYKLEDIAEILNSKRVPLNSRQRAERKGDIPYYGASGIMDYVNDYLFDGEHVLISEDGENLRSRKTPIAFKANGRFWVNNHAHIVRGQQSFLNDWIVYYIANLNVNPYISGAVQPKLNKQNLLSIPIVMPELKEVEAIASILSALDDKIENNLAMNKTLEAMAMALYKHWFVDFGPFQDGKFIDSEMGLIPEGWEVHEVKDFGRTVTGKTPSKKNPEHFGEFLPFVTPTGFRQYGRQITHSDRMISESGAAKHRKCLIPENSVVVTCIGSDMGKVALTKVRCLTNQQINSLVTKNHLYMYCFFVSQYNLLRSMAGDGTTMPIINKTDFERIKILKPIGGIVEDFEEKITSLDSQMLSNTLENQTLTNLRDTLLPKLISGEVRVKDYLKTVSEVL